MFTVERSIEILRNTPEVLSSMLTGISPVWYESSTREQWGAFDIVGHFVNGDLTDWVPRMRIILSEKKDKTFEPFDRFAQFEQSKGKSLGQLLLEFKDLREKSIEALTKASIENKLDLKGIHPALGEVTLRQLIATWTVHDLNHIMQLTKSLANLYKMEVGPWEEYLSVLKD